MHSKDGKIEHEIVVLSLHRGKYSPCSQAENYLDQSEQYYSNTGMSNEKKGGVKRDVHTDS
jgi:hypothetical protein